VVRNWCRQAYTQGLLNGYLNEVGKMANDFCIQENLKTRYNSEESLHEHLDEIFDMWMAIKAPEVWERKQQAIQQAEMEKQMSKKPKVISAKNMTDLMQQMMAIEDKTEDNRSFNTP